MKMQNASVVVTLPAGSDVREGDILRFEQAATNDALRRAGATVAVMRVSGEPHQLPDLLGVPGQIGVPVEMLTEADASKATVVVRAETKKLPSRVPTTLVRS